VLSIVQSLTSHSTHIGHFKSLSRQSFALVLTDNQKKGKQKSSIISLCTINTGALDVNFFYRVPLTPSPPPPDLSAAAKALSPFTKAAVGPCNDMTHMLGYPSLTSIGSKTTVCK